MPGQMTIPARWVPQKALKRREPQRHEDTNFFWACLSCVGKQKSFLCASVSLWFKAFMLFATACFGKMVGGRCFLPFCLSPYSLMSTSRINTDFTQAIALQNRGGVETTAWMISIRTDVLGSFSARNLLRLKPVEFTAVVCPLSSAEPVSSGQASRHQVQ